MLTLNIPAISCGHCVRAVTEAVQEIDPGASVEVDIEKKQARVTSQAEPGELIDKLAEEGYPATMDA